MPCTTQPVTQQISNDPFHLFRRCNPFDCDHFCFTADLPLQTVDFPETNVQIGPELPATH